MCFQEKKSLQDALRLVFWALRAVKIELHNYAAQGSDSIIHFMDCPFPEWLVIEQQSGEFSFSFSHNSPDDLQAVLQLTFNSRRVITRCVE
jgi:hypothetical protein